MTEDVELNGQIITVHVEERGRGQWTWWFAPPGGGRPEENTDRPLPDADAMLREGKQAALDYLRRRA